jgi:predicted nucleic acid-binding Zn finger protein
VERRVAVHYSQVLAELENVKVEGRISRRKTDELRRAFGARFTAAWKLVKEGRVKKYVFKPSGKVQWIVVGRERDYIIYEASGYCSCDDFYMSIMEGRAKACKHLIAQRLACELGLYEVVEEEDKKYGSLMEEWRKVERLQNLPLSTLTG